MKKYISTSTDRSSSPKRYLYEICDHLSWNVPMFTDPAAGGYRLRYREDSKEEAQETVDLLVYTGAKLGIDIVRPMVKPAGRGQWYAYCVVPRYESE